MGSHLRRGRESGRGESLGQEPRRRGTGSRGGPLARHHRTPRREAGRRRRIQRALPGQARGEVVARDRVGHEGQGELWQSPRSRGSSRADEVATMPRVREIEDDGGDSTLKEIFARELELFGAVFNSTKVYE